MSISDKQRQIILLKRIANNYNQRALLWFRRAAAYEAKAIEAITNVVKLDESIESLDSKIADRQSRLGDTPAKIARSTGMIASMQVAKSWFFVRRVYWDKQSDGYLELERLAKQHGNDWFGRASSIEGQILTLENTLN